jgi:glycosyltransferase involved in cell wall biosynthesis
MHFEPTRTVVPVENLDWSLATETTDILNFDIGIMPLRDDEWSRGKCAFKALQMMALGVPVVASPVGANGEVIQDGANGFLAAGTEAWVAKLSRLIDSPTLREELGQRGKATAMQRYSLKEAGEALGQAIRELCEAEG